MADVDATKNVYLFTHGRQDLIEKSTNALVSNGFSKDKIIMALPNKAGDVGDYMAMLWMPPNPDHIKIQKITKVEPAEAEGMIGVWKGVSKDDILKLKFKTVLDYRKLKFYSSRQRFTIKNASIAPTTPANIMNSVKNVSFI